MVPPPPTPTLFPYTTLFRSKRPAGAAPGCPPVDEQDAALFDGLLESLFSDALHSHGRLRPFWQGNLDRKSTRLNSSHANISYAVFCLKKKTAADRFVVNALMRIRQG